MSLSFVYGKYANIYNENNPYEFRWYKYLLMDRAKYYFQNHKEWSYININNLLWHNNTYSGIFLNPCSSSSCRDYWQSKPWYQYDIEKKKRRATQYKRNRSLKKHMSPVDWIVSKIFKKMVLSEDDIRYKWKILYYINKHFSYKSINIINSSRWNKKIHAEVNTFVNIMSVNPRWIR